MAYALFSESAMLEAWLFKAKESIDAADGVVNAIYLD